MNEHHHKKRLMPRQSMVILFVLAAIVGIYLWFEHGSHILSASPFLIFILLCPLMHFFMHKGHGGHGHHHHSGHGEQAQHKDKEKAPHQNKQEDNHDS